MMGKIICAGLGPGDPELMSIKANRFIRNASQIAYFCKKNTKGQARMIVEGMLREDVDEYPMRYPLTTEISFHSEAYRTALARFYEDCAEKMIALSKQDDVVVLCEGDPFFYGSYMHLYTRLLGKVDQEIIPAITGMSGCWSATGKPITWGDDILSILMGTLEEEQLTLRLQQTDAAVIMKTGNNLPKIRRALKNAGQYEKAWLVIKGTMADQQVMKLTDFEQDVCPYFSIILIHGEGRRP